LHLWLLIHCSPGVALLLEVGRLSIFCLKLKWKLQTKKFLE
jgi:hypothetical protein